MTVSYLNRLTLRQIDVFLAVCLHRSYSKAAEQLALTQPAVSSQIRSLEEVVGQALFDYLGKQLFLTSAGEVMLRAARELKQRLVHLEIELTDLHGRLQGSINIAIESSAEYLLPDYINTFCQKHPDVDITLHVVNHLRLLDRLRDNLDDLAIMTQVPEGRSLTFTPFAEHQLSLVANPDHPLSHKDEISLIELLEHPIVLRETGSGTRQIFEHFCQQQSCVIKHIRQMGSNTAIQHALNSGPNCAVLPTAMVKTAVAAGTLCLLPVHGFPISRSWCTVYPRGKHLNPLTKAFLNLLHGEATSTPSKQAAT
ncbi:HTH-type transcriptional activator CmpR [Zhongshania aliphaticivorans]|uniref:HTH-type transcriptional activator CmpR n=1 Tax=Zhongshania aliphaticivorans TaxID=1470434 RepID=A0A5S9NTF1_9GAMM|nr:LysR family transcriptional regulator [Zhongshania aliphaticivorans]CAA0093942.1 HTH-type transcriptional activator CmpR [Zhongshania aliphaticivorans]CAA0112032.1 HTH-type transcriptional activator CmpR [Zhongshania aliphaticivorans]